MSVDEETHRVAQLRVRDLDEVIADFDSRGVGLRPRDNLTRDELYDEAIDGSDAIRWRQCDDRGCTGVQVMSNGWA